MKVSEHQPFTVEWWNEQIHEESKRCTPENHGGLCQVVSLDFMRYGPTDIDPVRNLHAAIAYMRHVYGEETRNASEVPEGQ